MTESLAIIGTAGRQDDRNYMSRKLFDRMCESAESTCHHMKVSHLISGGAAWADHVAVKLFLKGVASKLDLHLPAPFLFDSLKFEETEDRYDTGRTANYYHKLFASVGKVEGLREIAQAIEAGANYTISNGFKKRNLLVAQCDLMLAFTFGTHSGIYGPTDPGYTDLVVAGLKDGGTAHTWTKATQPRGKKHINLFELL